MNAWKTAAVAAVLVGGAGIGAGFGPVIKAQTPTPSRAPRALEILGGRGSQIGVSIRDVETGNYFGGVTFNSVPEVFLAAQGTVGSWTFNHAAMDFTADRRYDVKAQATDAAGILRQGIAGSRRLPPVTSPRRHRDVTDGPVV